jgi:hypothetical protein
MTLVLTGLANGFWVEAEKTVDALGVDVFLVKQGASGSFVGATPFAPVDLGRIAALPGVTAAAPLVYAGGTVTVRGATRNADLFRGPEAGPGMPVTSEGRAPSTPDEVAVSSTLGLGVGDGIEIASRTLDIVGTVENSTALANLPNVFLTTAGAQQLVYGGQPLRVHRHSRHPQCGTGRLSRSRQSRSDRRSVATAEGGCEFDHDRGDHALFPMQVIVPGAAFVALPVIAVVIGLIASATGLRRAVSVDPAIAFGGP